MIKKDRKCRDVVNLSRMACLLNICSIHSRLDWVNVPEIVELFVRKERLNVSENVSLYHFRAEVERDFSKGKKEEGLLVRWTVFNESMD